MRRSAVSVFCFLLLSRGLLACMQYARPCVCSSVRRPDARDGARREHDDVTSRSIAS